MVLRLTLIWILTTVCWCRPPMPDATDDNFLNDCLETHNDYRSIHTTPALTLDQNIVEYAKTRCSSRSQSEGLSAGHSGLSTSYGENLYWFATSSSSVISCNQAVSNWYGENRFYNYSNPGFSSQTGHFTALVWKWTTRIGCARCSGQGSSSYETYIVCNYQPPGNVQGQYSTNVLPPKSTEDTEC